MSWFEGAGYIAVGALLREHLVPDEALSYLAAGSLSGAVAGAIGSCLLPQTDINPSLSLCIYYDMLNTGLSISAKVAGLLIAELLIDNSSIEMTKDCFIGVIAISSSLLGISAIRTAPIAASYCWNNCSIPSFFSNASPHSTNLSINSEPDIENALL